MLGVLGVAVYGNSFSVPFLFDDEATVLENPNVRQLWPLWRAMAAPPGRGSLAPGQAARGA